MSKYTAKDLATLRRRLANAKRRALYWSNNPSLGAKQFVAVKHRADALSGTKLHSATSTACAESSKESPEKQNHALIRTQIFSAQ
jgi:hypothetical protein